MAKEIEFSEEYSKLRLRFIKFKPKPSLIDLIGKNFDFILDIFIDNYKYLNSKKNWIVSLKNDKNIDKINEINSIFSNIESDIIVYYPQFKNSLKGKGLELAIDYFDKRDEWKTYVFYKYLKI